MSLANKMAKAGYIGDPGLFSSIGKFFGGVVKTGLGVVSKLGIPIVSGAAGIAGSFIGGGRGSIPGASTMPGFPPPPMPQFPQAMPGVMRLGPPGGFPQMYTSRMQPQQGMGFNPPFGGAPGAGFDVGGRRVSFGEVGQEGVPPGASMSGYHWNKTGYFLRDGTFIPPMSKLVKNRRRNALNPRALSRSLARITSAKRASKALGRITIRKTCPT